MTPEERMAWIVAAYAMENPKLADDLKKLMGKLWPNASIWTDRLIVVAEEYVIAAMCIQFNHQDAYVYLGATEALLDTEVQ